MSKQLWDLREFAPFVFVVVALMCFLAAQRLPEAPAVELREARHLMDKGALVIDVRPSSASTRAHIPGARLVSLDSLQMNVSQLDAERGRSILVYCHDGGRSGPRAVAVLRAAGFSGAVNLAGGIEGWRAAGLPTIPA